MVKGVAERAIVGQFIVRRGCVGHPFGAGAVAAGVVDVALGGQ